MRFKSSSASIPLASLRSAMVAATITAAGIYGGTTAGLAGDRSAGLLHELSARVNQYIAAWNTHDSEDLAQFFTADADMIMGNGPILGGRTAIQEWWRDYFAVQESERTLTIDVVATRAIGTDVALVNVRTTTGGRTREGLELLPRRARGTWILVRQDGEWLISAMRGMPTEQDRLIREGG
jgi:uncharacterized protein (TIGR02246 family)